MELPEKNGFPGVLLDCVTRDHELNQAISQGEYGFASLPRRLARNWKPRHRVANLGIFDDHVMTEIGVCRSVTEWAAGLPLTVNAAVAPEERAFRRRHSGTPL